MEKKEKVQVSWTISKAVVQRLDEMAENMLVPRARKKYKKPTQSWLVSKILQEALFGKDVLIKRRKI